MENDEHWESLVRQAQQGNKQAYNQFLEEVYPYIQRQVRSRMGGVLVSVDDVTQECLIGIHRSLATWHPSRKLKPWLIAIVRNKIADYFRKNMKIYKSELSAGMESVTNQVVSANNTVDEASETDSAHLGAVLNSLPDEQRRAIILTKVDGMSYSDAAATEGVTEAALRKRISRGYQMILKQLSQAKD